MHVQQGFQSHSLKKLLGLIFWLKVSCINKRTWQTKYHSKYYADLGLEPVLTLPEHINNIFFHRGEMHLNISSFLLSCQKSDSPTEIEIGLYLYILSQHIRDLQQKNNIMQENRNKII